MLSEFTQVKSDYSKDMGGQGHPGVTRAPLISVDDACESRACHSLVSKIFNHCQLLFHGSSCLLPPEP
jgi:hypothetical protein